MTIRKLLAAMLQIKGCKSAIQLARTIHQNVLISPGMPPLGWYFATRSTEFQTPSSAFDTSNSARNGR